MTYLGIDYGSKRIGIALSDPEGTIAFPECVLANTPQVPDEIATLCVEKNVQALVLGDSHRGDGTPNEIMQEIQKFKTTLESAIHLPIHFESEWSSSFQVERVVGKHAMLDASSAAIILQTWLERKNNRERVNEK